MFFFKKQPIRNFINQWLHKKARELMGFSLIHLSGPVGTCKSTLARLIALIHQVPVVLVDELGKNQKFYLILVDGTKKLLTPESVLPDNFKVVIANCGANCGANPKNLPNKKNGTFPAVEATQKLEKLLEVRLLPKSRLQLKLMLLKRLDVETIGRSDGQVWCCRST